MSDIKDIIETLHEALCYGDTDEPFLREGAAMLRRLVDSNNIYRAAYPCSPECLVRGDKAKAEAAEGGLLATGYCPDCAARVGAIERFVEIVRGE